MTFWVDVKIEVRGQEILNNIKGPAVVIANHQVYKHKKLKSILKFLELTRRHGNELLLARQMHCYAQKFVKMGSWIESSRCFSKLSVISHKMTHF